MYENWLCRRPRSELDHLLRCFQSQNLRSSSVRSHYGGVLLAPAEKEALRTGWEVGGVYHVEAKNVLIGGMTTRAVGRGAIPV